MDTLKNERRNRPLIFCFQRLHKWQCIKSQQFFEQKAIMEGTSEWENERKEITLTSLSICAQMNGITQYINLITDNEHVCEVGVSCWNIYWWVNCEKGLILYA